MTTTDEDDDLDLPPSKSQRKRDSHELQVLGEKLVQLPPAKLKKIPLSQQLLDAIHLAQKITARGAHKRQLQYIGKLMRGIDAEPIIQQLDEFNQQAAKANKHFHALEKWRDRLIQEGDTAVTELYAQHPRLDLQQLRQLVRNAQKEQQNNAAPRAARALFQLLRQGILDQE